MTNEFEFNNIPELLEESAVKIRVSGVSGDDNSVGIVADDEEGFLDLSVSDESRVRMELDSLAPGTAVSSRVSDGCGPGNDGPERGRSSDARVCSFDEPMISISDDVKASSFEEVRGGEESGKETEPMDFEVKDFRLNVPNDPSEHMRLGTDESDVTLRPSTHKFDTGNDPFEFVGDQDGISPSSRGESAPSPYDSYLSKFDEYVANGGVTERVSMSKAVHLSLEPGEMVWGKVKSHPWWPGHIFNETFASSSVRRTKREGHVLVAFFGDSSYGWFDPSELVPFDSNFAEKSQQINLRTFAKAVEEALDEASRRCFLGLACRCRNPHNFRTADIKGHFVVDVKDFTGGIYSEMQISKARESFQPVDTLAFIRHLAMNPYSNDHKNVYSIKNTSKVFAYRKAVFEEFDETYSEAFGFDLEKPPNNVTKEPAKQAHRAPLSGPMVMAEALGGAKSSVKIKNQSKKDKYLFKRRDEQKNSNGIQITGASSEIATGEYILQKRPPPVPIKSQGIVKDEGNTSVSTLENNSIVKENTAIPFHSSPVSMGVDGSVSSIQCVGIVQQEGEKKIKKGKSVKRTIGNLGSDISVQGEKQRKKKKHGIEIDSNPNYVQKHSSSTGKRVDLISNSQVVDLSNMNLELPQLLNDLHFLALDPFHGADMNTPAIIRQVLLRFRGLVYQKSSSVEIDTNDSSGPNKTLAVFEKSSGEDAKDFPERKPPRPMGGRPDDPTKGGRKRAPSDRQEEMATKKQKKIDGIKSMTAEKKTGLNNQETVAAPPQQKKLVRQTPVKKLESPKRVAEPTMLVMKFPLQTALPSATELKARFARFGPLDHDGTRIFWKTSSCRVVFRYKIDAQKAYKFAVGNNSLFGNVSVRYFLRDTPENQDSGKVDYAFLQTSVPSGTELRSSALIQQTPPVQLKSCLKKVTGDDSGNSNNGKRPRVKFLLDGEEEQQLMMTNTGSSSSTPNSSVGMKFISNNFQKVSIPPPPFLPLPSQFAKNTQFNDAPAQLPPPPPPRTTMPTPTTVDISQPMLNLLTRCNDVVSNVRSMLGYVPYHPL